MGRRKKGEGYKMPGHTLPGPKMRESDDGPLARFRKALSGSFEIVNPNTTDKKENWQQQFARTKLGSTSLIDLFRKKKKDDKEKDKTVDKNKPLRGSEAIDAVYKETKDKYGYLPWEDGYTEENEVQYDENGKPIPLSERNKTKTTTTPKETKKEKTTTNVKPENTQKTTKTKTYMKDFPLRSKERKAEYDKRNWKYDETIKGYNRDGSKK